LIIYVRPCGLEMLFNNITFILLKSISNLDGGTYILLKYISNYTLLHDGTMLIKSTRHFKSTSLYGSMYILLKSIRLDIHIIRCFLIVYMCGRIDW